VSDPQLKRWLAAFDALPTVASDDDTELSLDRPSDLARIRAGWLKGGFKGRGLWEERDDPRTLLRRRFAAFFEQQYRSIVDDTSPAAMRSEGG
jgi:hypothetical protein